jgi:hypothetical protein
MTPDRLLRVVDEQLPGYEYDAVAGRDVRAVADDEMYEPETYESDDARTHLTEPSDTDSAGQVIVPPPSDSTPS